MCPTRDRPDGLRRLTKSVLETSKAKVMAYVDEDQAGMYEGADATVTIGERVGPVAAANMLVERFRGYDVYGMVTDDSIITTPGWDEWVLGAIDQFPNRIAVISPHHNNGNHVDMPFVSRKWIEATGWFACPAMFHYAWPTITSLIGEMAGIVHAPKQKFHIEHDYVDGTYPERRARDYEAFYNYVSLRLPETVEKVRRAMFSSVPA